MESASALLDVRASVEDLLTEMGETREQRWHTG